MKTRNFVFTKNNYGDDYPDHTKFKYICWGKEIAPETGTPHLQGFAQLANPHTLAQAIAKLPGCHVEIMRAKKCAEARAYALKGGDITEHGIFSDGQGCRRDIKGMTKQVLEGARMDELDPTLVVKFHHGIEKLKAIHSAKRDWKTEVIVFWGKPGTGKSRRVRELAGIDAYYKPGNPKWWNGYDGDEIVVINEFSWHRWCECKDVGREQTLDIFDRYPTMVETKGGFAQLLARRIYLTTNENPLMEWPQEMLRRVTELHEVV